jgi:branched-chain amino acid transport system permease protein
MADFFQQVVSGLASGGVYGSLALAIVLIHRATGVINFAQGEMATFSTYIAWTLTTNHGLSYWPAFAVTLLVSFAGGVGIFATVIGPVERKSPIVGVIGTLLVVFVVVIALCRLVVSPLIATVVALVVTAVIARPMHRIVATTIDAASSTLQTIIVTIGLLLLINGSMTWIWSGEVRSVASPFPTRTIDIGGVAISVQDIGTIAVCLGSVVVLWAFFQFTKVGLALRAAAVNPSEARLVGVRVPWMLGLGWGLAAVLGAIAGMLTAPSVFLDPNMMQAVLCCSAWASTCSARTSTSSAPISGCPRHCSSSSSCYSFARPASLGSLR